MTTLYFIYKQKVKGNHLTIVSDTLDLEDAIAEIKNQAKLYVMKKNHSLFDTASNEKSDVDVKYFIRDSKTDVNVIDVFQHTQTKKKGWTSNYYNEETLRIAYFSYSKYAVKNLESASDDVDIPPPPPLPSIEIRNGIVSPELLRELKASNLFMQRRKCADANILPEYEMEMINLI